MTLSLRILVATLAFGAGSASAQSAYQTRSPLPGMWDLRLGGEADVLLAHAAVHASADWAVLRAGDGTVGVGLEAGLVGCVLSCGSASGVEVSRWAATPMARIAWHYVVGGETPNVAEVDLYAVALGGAGVVFQEARASGATLRSAEPVPLAGLGLGSLYFPGEGEVLFAGGELRVLYARETSRAELPGSALMMAPWSLAGVRLVFTMGVRL